MYLFFTKRRSYREMGDGLEQGEVGEEEEGGCWQPLSSAGTRVAPVINERLGERKPLLRSQHLPLPETAQLQSRGVPSETKGVPEG